MPEIPLLSASQQASPMRGIFFSWGWLAVCLFTCSAEVNSACAKVFLWKTLVTPHLRREKPVLGEDGFFVLIQSLAS